MKRERKKTPRKLDYRLKINDHQAIVVDQAGKYPKRETKKNTHTHTQLNHR